MEQHINDSSRYEKGKKFICFSPHLVPFEVIQPSSYLDDPTIVKPKSRLLWIILLYFSIVWHKILHVSLAAVPDLPVMYSGGVLHIQSDSLSTEALFHLSQSAALLAAIRLQDMMNGSEPVVLTN